MKTYFDKGKFLGGKFSVGVDPGIKKKTLWSLFMDGIQLPQGYSHYEEAVYFLPLSSQNALVLILSTSNGWAAVSWFHL